MEKPTFSIGEEIANAITHGIGALLAIAALVILIVKAAQEGDARHVVSFSVFGSSMVILYISSTLYHALVGVRTKKVFRKFDHMSIFLLIAGTYTPFCLAALKGWIGWTIFGVIWGLAVIGIVLKALFTGKMEMLSTIAYVLMGWVILFAIKPLYDSVSGLCFTYLVLGGVSYTLGTFFFIKDKRPYFHSIWHLFVLGGSVMHFFAVMNIL